MELPWKETEFKLGINMPGAISAGAYTAGVLDFLMEGLEEWQARKDAIRKYLDTGAGPRPEAVPMHDVCLDVFSGASAGGMCAALASVMVQQDFAHIKTGMETGTTNTFYEAWVNQINIEKLLKTQDVDSGRPLVSLLDSTIIDTIAATALAPKPATPKPAGAKPYVADHLTLFLCLTNLRGTHYRLYSDPKPSMEETATWFGDRLRFETSGPDLAVSTPNANPLPRGDSEKGAWPLLREGAKATGAFPVVLAPRVVTRKTTDYLDPPWAAPGSSDPVPPLFPEPRPETITTLNVDGGLTDNDPFELAHHFLVGRNPKQEIDSRTGSPHNPREADKANCAVISVAPFPSAESEDGSYVPSDHSGIIKVAARCLDVLISQSRFLGQSMHVLMTPNGFSRFLVAPTDGAQRGGRALQCSSLGAFGGFFERGFRAHDFLLGRRNCQRFLQTHLCFPVTNPVIAAGQAAAGVFSEEITRNFKVSDVPGSEGTPAGVIWIPLIPCTGTAKQTVELPGLAKISASVIADVAEQIMNRAKAIQPGIAKHAPGWLTILSWLAVRWPLSASIQNALTNALTNAFARMIE